MFYMCLNFYTLNLNSKFQNKTDIIKLGCHASNIGSDCLSSNGTQTLVLSEPTYMLTMIFERKAGKVHVSNVTFNYTVPGLPKGEDFFKFLKVFLKFFFFFFFFFNYIKSNICF